MPRLAVTVALLAFSFSTGPGTRAAPAVDTVVDTVVVCPPAWWAAMDRWVRLRRSQGRGVRIIAPGTTADGTRRAITEAAASPSPSWVVLVGDVGDGPSAHAVAPTWLLPAKINVRHGSPPDIATDLPYADANGDGLPDAAVGRLPVDSAGELRAYLDRVVAYESAAAATPPPCSLRVVAAPAGFSPIVERAIEVTARRVLSQLTPPACDLHLTYADWRSPYCPYPPHASAAVVAGLQQRSLAWVYLGHGHRSSLDLLRTPLGYAKLLDNKLLDKPTSAALRGADFPPVAALLACDTGAFDGPDDCLAEELIRQPGGPLAAIAGSRVTMPYGNARLGLELLGGLFPEEPADAGDAHPANANRTVGRLLQHAMRRMEAAPGSPLRQTIDLIAAGLGTRREDRDAERLEHRQMYNLLGDPLLTLRRPQPIAITARRMGDGDHAALIVTGESPVAGDCLVGLRRQTDQPLAPRGPGAFELNDECRRRYESRYAAANRPFEPLEATPIPRGSFHIALPLRELPMTRASEQGRDEPRVRIVLRIAGQNTTLIGQAPMPR